VARALAGWPRPHGTADGAAFNPAGNVIALQDGNAVTIVPTPQPMCNQTQARLRFQPRYFRKGR
jgi:hypothetical protein